MKHTVILISILVIFFSACNMDQYKDEITNGLKEGQEIFAASDFHKAVGFIELHKLRNGHYPESIEDLQFLSVFDSSIFHSIYYEKIDTGYIVNIATKYSSLQGESDITVRLKYPDEFWSGLGCIESNAME